MSMYMRVNDQAWGQDGRLFMDSDCISVYLIMDSKKKKMDARNKEPHIQPSLPNKFGQEGIYYSGIKNATFLARCSIQPWTGRQSHPIFPAWVSNQFTEFGSFCRTILQNKPYLLKNNWEYSMLVTDFVQCKYLLSRTNLKMKASSHDK